MSHVKATITMSTGEAMRLELYPEKAPNTVANFAALCREGYYDGLTFHRVVKDFMIQGGAKNGSCEGNTPGFLLKGEFAENGVDTGLKHVPGVISMARADHPDSASTQFFIMRKATIRLDGKYAAFGALADEESFAVLDRIANVPTKSPEEENRPLTPQVIASITVETDMVLPPPERIPSGAVEA